MKIYLYLNEIVKSFKTFQPFQFFSDIDFINICIVISKYEEISLCNKVNSHY